MGNRLMVRCRQCGCPTVPVHGHFTCQSVVGTDLVRCHLWGQPQSECCSGETAAAEVLSDAQKGLQGGQDSVSGTGAHRDKAGAQNGR